MSREFVYKEFIRVSKIVSDNKIDPSSLKRITYVKELIDYRHSSSKIKRFYIILFSVIGYIFILMLLNNDVPVTKRWLLLKYLEFYEETLEESQCIVNNPQFKVVSNFLRPPVPCEICKDIKNIKRVSNISMIEFETEYAYSGIPIIVTDAMKTWNATNIFSLSFFKSIYSADSPVLDPDTDKAGCQFFNYDTNFTGIADLFEFHEKGDGKNPWYIGWGNCDPDVANILRNYYERPYFLPEFAESSKIDWIFMGSPKYGAPLHIDFVGKPSWQAQVTGTKRWRLEPVPECYHVCEPFLEEVVQTGEIIVLNTDIWYHSTLIEGNEISITIGSEYD